MKPKPKPSFGRSNDVIERSGVSCNSVGFESSPGSVNRTPEHTCPAGALPGHGRHVQWLPTFTGGSLGRGSGRFRAAAHVTCRMRLDMGPKFSRAESPAASGSSLDPAPTTHHTPPSEPSLVFHVASVRGEAHRPTALAWIRVLRRSRRGHKHAWQLRFSTLCA